VSTLPPDFARTGNNAAVVVHPSGRFVYSSNRAHNSIAMFEVDDDTGRLNALGWEPTQGTLPRNFNIDPSGTVLLAANQNGNTIVSFRIDQETGRLSATGAITRVTRPVCVQFGATAAV
jgi:6-phosphogluconolactonase